MRSRPSTPTWCCRRSRSSAASSWSVLSAPVKPNRPDMLVIGEGPVMGTPEHSTCSHTVSTRTFKLSWLVIHASATAAGMKAAEDDYPRPAHHRAPRGRRGRNGPAVSGRLPASTCTRSRPPMPIWCSRPIPGSAVNSRTVSLLRRAVTRRGGETGGKMRAPGSDLSAASKNRQPDSQAIPLDFALPTLQASP